MQKPVSCNCVLRLKHDPPAECAQWRRDFFDEHYETPTFEQRKHNFDGDVAMLRSGSNLDIGASWSGFRGRFRFHAAVRAAALSSALALAGCAEAILVPP